MARRVTMDLARRHALPGRIRIWPLLAIFAALLVPVKAQHRVDPHNLYERLYAIVPIIGKGTLDDPKRPMYAPAPSQQNPTSRTGILGFTHVVSDDGRF